MNYYLAVILITKSLIKKLAVAFTFEFIKGTYKRLRKDHGVKEPSYIKYGIDRVVENADYTAVYNVEIDGYVIVFSKTGHVAQIKFKDSEEKIKLIRYREFDDPLNENENAVVDKIVFCFNES